jgi:hypothetical protein
LACSDAGPAYQLARNTLVPVKALCQSSSRMQKLTTTVDSATVVRQSSPRRRSSHTATAQSA